MSYTSIENAVVARFREYFSEELTEYTCQAADLDAVLEAMFSGGHRYGCYLDIDSSGHRPRETFKGITWSWGMTGVFLVLLDDDADSKVRSVIDKLFTVFLPDHTLGGVTPKVEIVRIEQPEPGKINEVPFYFIPFSIEAWDKQ